jgi:RNA polymerase sigma-70 factor (ECF subfamily)
MDPQRRAREDRFEKLFALARDPLLRYFARRAAPDVVEDLFAEAMTVAWRRLDDVPAGAELQWLYGVGRKVLANHRRSGSRFGRLVERLAMVDHRSDPDLELGASIDPDLADAVSKLPPNDAEILRLWAWEDLTAGEIAAVLRITPNAASIRLHRAKARLKTALEDDPRKTALIAGHQAAVERTEAR